MADADWTWDETLYAGSAAHYAVGRMPYPPGLADVVRDELDLDGQGWLLDVGCGPGSLTLLLAPLFEAAVGVDADEEMLAEASRRAASINATNVSWHRARAEDLPADLGAFRVASFAQSFHWMDQPLVAQRVRGMLEPTGAWVHVGATTHRGEAGEDQFAHPRPPWERIEELVATYLGPVRRAGQSTLPTGTRGGEQEVMKDAGFSGPTRIPIGGDQVVDRDVDQVASAVFSLSSSAPHLFAADLPRFEADLRQMLTQASDGGQFSERTREAAVVIWRV